jgi:hypothetical protein
MFSVIFSFLLFFPLTRLQSNDQSGVSGNSESA